LEALKAELRNISQQLQDARDRCVKANRGPTDEEKRWAHGISARIETIKKEFEKNMDQKLAMQTIKTFAARLERGEQLTTQDQAVIQELMEIVNHEDIPEILTRPVREALKFPVGEPERSGGQYGFKSLGDFFSSAINMGVADPRVAQTLKAAQRVGLPSEGGFLVPEGFSTALLDFMVEQSPILSRVRRIPMNTSTVKCPALDDRNHSGSIGGLQGVWLSEAATMNVDTVVHQAIELEAKKIGILVRGSREYFQDGVTAEQFIRAVMTRATSFYIDQALVKGTGAGQPLGLLNAPGKVSVTKLGGQTADTFLYENACAMFQALDPAAKGAFWLVSPSVKTQLLIMGVNVGTGGIAYFPALNQAQDITTLLGLPVFYSEHCSVLGDEGDVILVNPGGYVVGMRQEIQVDLSPHVYFTSDEIALRIICRLDGQPTQSTTLTLSDGVTVVSDIVTLAARA
jgi:HK97 family phage major capsid protein